MIFHRFNLVRRSPLEKDPFVLIELHSITSMVPAEQAGSYGTLIVTGSVTYHVETDLDTVIATIERLVK